MRSAASSGAVVFIGGGCVTNLCIMYKLYDKFRQILDIFKALQIQNKNKAFEDSSGILI